MARAWVFIDEQGDVKFGERNSRFFGLAAVTTYQPSSLVAEMERLRELFWSESHMQDGYLHAQRGCFEVNKAVFDSFSALPIERCDVVALRKAAIFTRLRNPREMYSLALRLLLEYVVPRIEPSDELTVVLAKWQPGPDLPALAHIVLERATFERRANTTVLQAPSAAHAGLQYADYLAFASHRQRTRGEERWLNATRMPARAYSDFTAF